MTSASETPAPGLAPFVKQRNILLTTYKRDGTAVGTPVNIAVDGDHAYIRTYDKAWKAKRMRNNPEVEISPSTARGVPTGPPFKARVRLLDAGSEEARRAAKLLQRKHRILQGVFVPVFHRLRKYRTLHYEVRLLGE
ncbi:PPOX class F420-dependent oxidoreductase [Streptomyces sp. TRM66268-LWL]|uniref:PPOX class F420-dependent oxidoreductase n=1 Tax=Streptomyces polyasparticus TaxID=2767826 RepID=A0ABR7SPJ6_9ACTN|nr:PPOX class F420-dependent oxidoreductase [Streptomyces polyasparticus]MBC9716456.1 PPOX class F420-dependent oxidoreductase [Streptomyces polyasparticus]